MLCTETVRGRARLTLAPPVGLARQFANLNERFAQKVFWATGRALTSKSIFGEEGLKALIPLAEAAYGVGTWLKYCTASVL